MAKSSTSLTPHIEILRDKYSNLKESPFYREIQLILLFLLNILLLICLFSFNPNNSSFYSSNYPSVQNTNFAGRFGSYLAHFLIYQIGFIAFATPATLSHIIWIKVKKVSPERLFLRLTGWFILLTSLSFIIQSIFNKTIINGTSVSTGGKFGIYLNEFLKMNFGSYGSFMVTVAGMVIGIMLASQKTFLSEIHNHVSRYFFREKTSNIITPRKPHKVKQKVPKSTVQKSDKKEDKKKLFSIPEIPENFKQPLLFGENISNEQKHDEPSEPASEATSKKITYEAPSLDIFKSDSNQGKLSPKVRKEFEATGAQLLKALNEFGIEGQILAIQPGPVVTVYEFEPSAGIKLSKVTGLMDDIALSLRVDSIFIHPVSGKKALGIQVPNKTRQTVFLGDIFNTEEFQSMESPLTFAMGKNLNGFPVSTDLATMPHLLMAGQTGSGKSVAINSLLCSIVMKSQPSEVKFIMVDPKILELKIYEGIPHLLMPVITESNKASLALKWACCEMDRRYKVMETAKVRHIKGFNKFWNSANQKQKNDFQEKAGVDITEPLPFIVIVIDELADLMLTAPKDVEGSIQRLAQKARACGIHLVLATQRPSVDVITGVIKANLPSRIAFKVFSRGDSRTILDGMGAERLLGKGDMLYLKPGNSKFERIQGAFLDDNEVVAMVDAIKVDGTSHYNQEAIKWIEEEYERQNTSQSAGSGGGGADEDDPKWNDAIDVGIKHGVVSASFLQRHLKIGYNRAARIVESMEEQGLVGAAEGSKPRKWLGPTH